MDLKNLLGKLDLIESTMTSAEKNPTGPKFTGQWKGTDKGLPGKKLVGDSIEPEESILKDLSKGPTPKTREQELAEEFQAFLEAEFKDTEDHRPARKGSREEKVGKRGHKEQPRYKTVKESIGDSEEATAVVDEVIQLISDGHTEVSPDVIIAKVSAALGRPFMLKDLVAANNASPEMQHYIDSINPTKIKFSTDILTVKNQDPAKEKEKSQAGVANMAARAANRPRLGESQGISKDAETEFHAKLDTLVHNTFGKRKDEVEEGVADQVYTVDITRSRGMGPSTTRSTSGTIPELLDYFGYTLEVGKSYEHERGRYKINMNPRNIQQLVDALNKAASNGAANGAASTFYSQGNEQLEEEQLDEGTGIGDLVKFKQPYKHNGQEYLYGHVTGFSLNPKKLGVGMGYGHTAATPFMGAEAKGLVVKLKPTPYHTDDYADKVTVPLDSFVKLGSALGGGAVQSEIHKFNKLYGFPKPGERIDYSKILGQEVDEGWGGMPGAPDDRPRRERDPDDWYDQKRQDQMDIEAEKENAKRPQEQVYTLLGRGPNMEPNYKFPGEYTSQEDAIAARAKLMADPKTPHPEHIGIHSYTRYLDQTNESAFNPPKSKEDYDAKMAVLWKLEQDPNTKDDPALVQRITWQRNQLRKAAEQAGFLEMDLDAYTKQRDAIYRQLANPTNADNYTALRQELQKLNARAKSAGIKIEESRAHKQLATWFKNRERLEKFAKGELNIPTPQERKAELEKSKSKKKVTEYGADSVSPYGQPTQKVDPQQAKEITQGLQAFKSAAGLSAPTTNIAKAMDEISQGKTPSQQTMKTLEPALQGLNAIAKHPNIASNTFKSAIQQAKQAEKKV